MPDVVLAFSQQTEGLREVALFQRDGILLSVALIQYELEDGDASEEVCYWKDMTLLPHLINLLGKSSVRARLSCVRIDQLATDRKELARQLHSEMLRLKERDAGAQTAGPRVPADGVQRPRIHACI